MFWRRELIDTKDDLHPKLISEYGQKERRLYDVALFGFSGDSHFVPPLHYGMLPPFGDDALK